MIHLSTRVLKCTDGRCEERSACYVYVCEETDSATSTSEKCNAPATPSTQARIAVEQWTYSASLGDGLQQQRQLGWCAWAFACFLLGYYFLPSSRMCESACVQAKMLACVVGMCAGLSALVYVIVSTCAGLLHQWLRLPQRLPRGFTANPIA